MWYRLERSRAEVRTSTFMRLNEDMAEQPEGEIVTFKVRMTNTVQTPHWPQGHSQTEVSHSRL